MKFPLILCLILFLASCAISRAEFLGEVPSEINGSGIVLQKIVEEERCDFEKNKVKKPPEKVPFRKWKKAMPSADEQKSDIKLEVK